MIIRMAEDRDAPDLSQLLAQLGYPASIEESLRRIHLCQQDAYHLVVGELDHRCIGFIALHWYHAFHHPKPIGRIVAFCIDEAYRGKGLGSELLTDAENFFQQKECLRVELTSNLKRKESHEYYLHKGYEQRSMHFVKYLIK